jgi:GNAT superfamily N-acetyltransferase
VRQAGSADIDKISATLALAFATDPIWGPALARPDGSTEHLEPIWRCYVLTSLDYETVWMMDDAAAVAVWTPPGGDELSAELQAELDRLVAESLPPESVAAFHTLGERFDEHHPHDVPHAYLGLLATHPTHRGKGIGQQLLAENLVRFDADGVPAFLESSNPANNHRYERAGFHTIGGFDAVLDDAHVSTMWRDARSG